MQRTGGLFGTAEEVARNRTLLRYYRPFLTPKQFREATAAMAGGTVAHLKFRLGLLTSRFRANHPLKACRSCMADDRVRCGWAYWHLEHQYPGVWFCCKHGEPLQVSMLKSTGVERFFWHLPSLEHLKPFASAMPTSSALQLMRLAATVKDVISLDLAEGALSDVAVQAVLIHAMQVRGWMTEEGSLRLAQISPSYLEFVANLKSTPELSTLPSNLEEAKLQIGRLLRPMRSGTHPLRWLIAVSWLFEDTHEFTSLLYTRGKAPAIVQAQDQTLGDRYVGLTSILERTALRNQVLSAFHSGQSATAAAREAHVDVTTAMAWLAENGIAVKRRPKVLLPSVRAALIEDLSRGAEKVEAAQRHGVSVETITRILRTEIGLHGAWKTSRFERARTQARNVWSTVCQKHRLAGIKLIRAVEPAAYAWLYRNDRIWLKENSPTDILRSVEVGSSPVRWDVRDQVFCLKVEQVVLELQCASTRRLKLWQIYQAVPELKPKLSALNRMPLTQRALARALSRRVAEICSSGSLF